MMKNNVELVVAYLTEKAQRIKWNEPNWIECIATDNGKKIKSRVCINQMNRDAVSNNRKEEKADRNQTYQTNYENDVDKYDTIRKKKIKFVIITISFGMVTNGLPRYDIMLASV